ncbi:MAG: hypothetical protein QNJ49_21000 [Mastigocoleus sp. MO_167.B18]|nr:hypothetical protein [Mastigocoleus sp. MO_167.B18]
MARKRLSDLLQEETKKVTQIEDAAAIDVKATPVDASAVEEEKKVNTSVSSSKSTNSKSTNSKNSHSENTKNTNTNQADLEATIKELKATLEQAHENEATFEHKINDLESALSQQEGLASELKQELQATKKSADLEVTVQELQQKLEQAQHNEQLLEQRVNDLRTAIAAKDELMDRLKKDLQQAKQDAVKLAEINSALKEQINPPKQSKTYQQPKPQQTQQTQKSAIQPSRSADLRPQHYRKSHLVRDTRPITRSPKPSGPSSEDSSDNSSQMWLLD